MSEYQFYDFLALDRPLTMAERQELRAFSSRAEITAHRFTNHYGWGSFKGDPERWIERYFDAFLHFTNWGTRMLMLRLPAAALDPAIARHYCRHAAAAARVGSGQVILTFRTEDEEGEDDWWDEDEGLASLAPLRAAIARGDRRSLYLGWLLGLQAGTLDDAEEEPSRPPGLDRLDAALEAFVAFLRVDRDLLAAVADGEPAAARTVAGLRAAAGRRATERLRQQDERAARARELLERSAAAARERRLALLARRGEAAWTEVETLIATRQPSRYDAAVTLLGELLALAARAGHADAARARVARLADRHARKRSLLDRLRAAGWCLALPGAARELSPRAQAPASRPRPR